MSHLQEQSEELRSKTLDFCAKFKLGVGWTDPEPEQSVKIFNMVTEHWLHDELNNNNLLFHPW